MFKEVWLAKISTDFLTLKLSVRIETVQRGWGMWMDTRMECNELIKKFLVPSAFYGSGLIHKYGLLRVSFTSRMSIRTIRMASYSTHIMESNVYYYTLYFVCPTDNSVI